MLDLQRYTRQELIDIFKTQRLDSIKDKLKRKGYKFTTDGRGDSFTLTITELPLRFRNFCTDELNFALQTDFVKLKRFLYRFIFDEDFVRNAYIRPFAYHRTRLSVPNKPFDDA